MNDDERFKLRFGPYATPRFNYADIVMDGVQHEHAGEPRRAEGDQLSPRAGSLDRIDAHHGLLENGAAVLLRKLPAAKSPVANLEKKHSKAKAISILAARLGRTKYWMFKRKESRSMNGAF